MFGNQNKEGGSMDNGMQEEVEFDFEEATDIRDLDDADIQRALSLLNSDRKYKAKVKAGLVKGAKKVSEMEPEEYAKYKLDNARRNQRIKMQVSFAKENGFNPTDEEVDEELKAEGKL